MAVTERSVILCLGFGQKRRFSSHRMAVASGSDILWPGRKTERQGYRRIYMEVAHFLQGVFASASILDEANGSWSGMAQEIVEGGRML